MTSCRQSLTRYSHICKSIFSQSLRFNSTTASSTTAVHYNHHESTHTYLTPCEYIGSWKTPSSPKEAELHLVQLRREYAKKVKEIRKVYIHEMELQKLEKQMKDEAKKEALRQANQERKKLKATAAEARAAERKVAMEEFRKILMQERAEKLENWKMKEKNWAEKVKEKNELLRRQSSMWISEVELEKKIFEAIVSSTPL